MSYVARRFSFLLAGCLLLAAKLPEVAIAQQRPTGYVAGNVREPEGAILPGVRVAIEGVGPDRAQLTDERGEFRFLALDPGTYTLVAELEGWSRLEYPDVEVGASRSTEVALVLQRPVEEEIHVTAESPLLDERQITPGTTLTRTDLERVPTGNNQWALLWQVPGVVLDRVDVAGSESANPSRYRAAAVDSNQNDHQVDGLTTTFMWGLQQGGFRDVDQYSEVQYSTGGSDVTQRTPGVALNLITRRGSNQLRGSARLETVEADGYVGGLLDEAEPEVDASDLGPGQASFSGSRIRDIEEVGAEAGGPLIRNRLWLWAGASRAAYRTLIGGGSTDSSLRGGSLRLDAQLVAENSAVVYCGGNERSEWGIGAGIFRAPEAVQDEDAEVGGCHLVDTHVFSPRLFARFAYQQGDGGPRWRGRGGEDPEAPEMWFDGDGVQRDGASGGRGWGEGRHATIDGSYFSTIGAIDHELRLGGQVRDQPVVSDWVFPGGRDLYTITRSNLVVAKRGATPAPAEVTYRSLWAQDTLQHRRLTLNLGLRWDLQRGRNLPTRVSANPAFPGLLPALDFPGSAPEFEWESLAPRLGLTWALSQTGDTLLRASLGRFADQLSGQTVHRTNPAGFVYAVFFSQVQGRPYQGQPAFLVEAGGFNPANPGSLESPNRVDSGLDPPMTSEILLGLDHALRKDVAVGLTLTARNMRRVLEERTLVREPSGLVRVLRASEWLPAGEVSGVVPGTDYAYAAPVFGIPSSLRQTGGTLLLNGERERDYLGLTATVTKRLSDRWMMRAFLQWGRGEWDVPQDFLDHDNPNRSTGGGDRDDDLYHEGELPGIGSVISSGIDRGFRRLESTWTANVAGMVRIAPDRKWGFNVAGNLMAREGFPLPLGGCLWTFEPRRRCVIVTDELDSFRLPDVYLLDLRLERDIDVRGPVSLSVHVDASNVANQTVPQARRNDLDAGRPMWVTDTISPRIYRLGMRLRWR